MAFFFCYDYPVAPTENENRKLSLKDQFFANALNPLTIIFVAIIIYFIPQAVSILLNSFGVESEFIRSLLDPIVANATQIAGVLLGAAFLLFFFKRR